jgi:hypothetical protein
MVASLAFYRALRDSLLAHLFLPGRRISKGGGNAKAWVGCNPGQDFINIFLTSFM